MLDSQVIEDEDEREGQDRGRLYIFMKAEISKDVPNPGIYHVCHEHSPPKIGFTSIQWSVLIELAHTYLRNSI